MLFGGRKMTARTASFLVEVLLIAVLCVLLGLVFLSFLAPLPLPENTIVEAQPGEEQITAPLDVKSPFQTQTLSVEPPSAAPAVVETTLDLTLTGVWAAPEDASATIRIPDGTEKRFAVGDVIVSGVNLEAVYPDQVTLNRGGVREALRFESKVTPELQSLQSTSSLEQTLKLTSAATGRLASVLRLAVSTDADGNPAVEFHASRDVRTFAALGLQNGDRLVSINGAPAPTDGAALGRLLSEMQQGAAATIIVERGGEEKRIVFSTNKLGYD